jgi:hypothetical protein
MMNTINLYWNTFLNSHLYFDTSTVPSSDLKLRVNGSRVVVCIARKMNLEVHALLGTRRF